MWDHFSAISKLIFVFLILLSQIGLRKNSVFRKISALGRYHFWRRSFLFRDPFCCGARPGPCKSRFSGFRPQCLQVSKAVLGQNGLKNQYSAISCPWGSVWANS